MARLSKPFLPYPSMERQDLTQGQLGSFKFTPVDAVHKDINKEYLTAMAHQEMLTQLQSAAHHAVAMAADSANHPKPGFSNSRASLANPPTASTVFDQHFKPDLEDSRLKYGPAALRSAVDLQSSEKTRTQQPLPFHARRSSHLSAVEMNPVAGTFVPRGATLGFGLDDQNASLHALVRSLAAEQYAHHNTQIALEDAKAKVSELTGQLEAANMQDKRMKAQMDMLKGIIKHNRHEIEAETPTKLITEENTPKDPGPQITPIVYDVLARQRANRAAREAAEAEAEDEIANTVSVKEEEQLSTPRMRATPTIDDINLFRLDMLKSPSNGDPEQSAISRSLRRHFQESVSTAEDSQADRLSRVITPPPAQKPNTLISLSPEELAKNETYSSLAAAAKKLQQQATVMADTPTKRSTVKLAETPTLELPASFLAKYKAPSRPQTSGSTEDQDATPKTNIAAPAALSGNVQPPNLPLLLSPLSSPTRHRVAKLPQTVDFTLRWKVNRDNPIFEDEYEKESALGLGETHENRMNAFFDHPVRYLEYSGKDLFRTVMIDYIPVDASYTEVLWQICGGSLEKIELIPPIGNTTDYQTARVVFNHEVSAITTVNYAKTHGIIIKDKRVRVWQVMTQTWPKTAELYDLVHRQRFTRFMAFKECDEIQLETIPGKLEWLWNNVVVLGWTEDKLPVIEFTSVAAAVKALNQLVKDLDLGSVKFDFIEDPCDRPYPGMEQALL